MKKNITTITALSAAAMLLLASCGGDDAANAEENADALGVEDQSAEQEEVQDDAGAGVFTFHATDDMGPADEFRIELPEQLVEIADGREVPRPNADHIQNLVLEAVTVRAGSHDTSQCSLEMDFEFQEGMYELIADLNDDGHSEPGKWTLFTDAIPSVKIDDFADDFRSATVPVSCSSSPTEGDTITVPFVWFSEEAIGYAQPRLADVEVGVMASGDLHIRNAEVDEDYHYSGDEHGWLHKSQKVDSQGNLIGG